MLRAHMVKWEMLGHLQPDSSFYSLQNNPYSARRVKARRRVGEHAAVSLCVPQAVQKELQMHQGLLSWWPVLTQHLSLTQDIPGGWGAASERREELRRTCRDRAAPTLTDGL